MSILANPQSCRSFCSDKVGHYVYLLPLWIRKLCFDRYQIGGIGGLTPKNKPLLAQFGMRALLAGTLASLLSATVVGMIIG